MSLLNSLDEIVRRHVRPGSRGARPLLWPGVVAVHAVIILLHQPHFGTHAHYKVWSEEFPGELGVIHIERFALRTTNRVAQDGSGGIPFEQEPMGPLEL